MGLLRRFIKDTSAVAAVELALIFPVALLLVLGCFEVTRVIIIQQKMERARASMADLVAQGENPMTQAQLNDLFAAAKDLMSPYDLDGNGKVIVSSLVNPTNAAQPTIVWQRFSTGPFIAISHFGVQGATANGLPGTFKVIQGDNAIAAEIYYHYTPVLANLLFTGTTFYTSAFNRVRNNNLTTPPS